jgi:REP element-mobilizing transposase RayT
MIASAYDGNWQIMAYSYVGSVFHVVFSTKERAQLIRSDLQPKLWNYLAGIARNYGIHVLAVGGTENHVHLLMVFPADMKLSDLVRTLKANSSRWVRRNIPPVRMAAGLRGVQREPIEDRAGQTVHRQSSRASSYAFV